MPRRFFVPSALVTLILVICLLTGLPDHSAAQTPQPGLGLKVLGITPSGRTQRVVQIVARFNRDMAPLGTGEVAPENAPMRLSPMPAGSFRWLSPNTLAYILERPLTGSDRLTVTIPEGARALDGSTLAKAYKVGIKTPEIKVTGVNPHPKRALGPKTRIRLTLNQPVDIDSLARRIWFSSQGMRWQPKIKLLSPPEPRSGRIRLARTYEIVSPKPFPPSTLVLLSIKPGVAPSRGQVKLGKSINISYKTYSPLKLVSWRVPKALRGGLDPAGGISFKLNNPVSPKEFWQRVKILPKVPAPPEAERESPTRWLYFSPDFKPTVKYKLTIASGLKDTYGTALAQPVNLELAMGDLGPRFNMKEGVGVLEASDRPRYPVRVRNIESMLVGMRLVGPDQAVPLLTEVSKLRWNQKPKQPPKGSAQTASVVIRPKAAKNRMGVVALDLNRIIGRNVRGGLILLDAESHWPDYKGRMKPHLRRALLEVTNLGLSLKIGTSSGLAFVTGLKSGKPLSGVSLELRDSANRVLWQGKSDAKGAAKLPSLKNLSPLRDKERPWRNPLVYLLARHEGDFAIISSQWSQELRYGMPYSINTTTPGAEPDLAAHGLFQLPLYQPGQKVNYIAFVQAAKTQGLTPVAGERVKAVIQDPFGREIITQNGVTNRVGSLTGSFSLSPEARLGTYRLVLHLGKRQVSAGSFRVASFRPPDFALSLQAPKEHIGKGSAGDLRLSSAYLFGSPVVEAKVKLKSRQRETWFAPDGLDGYQVGAIPIPGQEPDLSKPLGVQQATTDSKGLADIPLPEARPAPGRPVNLVLSAQVMDASSRSVSAGSRVLFHPADIYLGIKAPLMAQADKPAKIEIKAVGYDNKPRTPNSIEVAAFREIWEMVREKGPGGYYRHLSRVRREKVRQITLTPGGAEAVFEFTPPQSGAYVITARVKDQAGRENLSSAYLWAAGKGGDAWQRFDDHRLELVSDKKQYRPGDSMKVMLKSPFKSATALVTIERQGVRRSLVSQVQGPAPTLEIPLLENDAPGVYLGVLLIRGRNKEARPGAPDLGKPQVRMGYAEVMVKSELPPLEVEVTPENKVMRPGRKARVKVKVSRAGEPRDCQVTLLAVDERVLSAAGGVNSYDPAKSFARMPPLAVITSDMRTDVVGKLLKSMKGESDAGGGGKGPRLRRKFHPAVFWLAQAKSGPDGLLEAEFDLPDSLTAYRIVAVAADKKGRFGKGRAKITARTPLQILSALPRFALSGDEFTARVLVQNLTGATQKATISASGDGFELLGPGHKRIELIPGRSHAVGFKVKALKKGRASLTIKAAMAGEQDAADFSLDILPPWIREATAAAGSLKPDGVAEERLIQLKAPKDAVPGQGFLSVEMAPSLASRMVRPARDLIAYPWNCLEQRVSRAAARSIRLRYGSVLGLGAKKTDQEVLKNLGGLLADYQTGGGGFTYWPGQSRPDLFLTAYTLVALKRIPQAKAPEEVVQNALDYLNRSLKRKKKPRSMKLSRRTAEALGVWALSLYGKKARPLLEAQLREADRLSPFGLAALMEAASLLKMNKARDRLFGILENAADITASKVHFTFINPAGLKVVMGSPLRGNALALMTLAAHQPGYHGLDGLALWVADRLAQSRSLSTQESVFGLWGLGRYLSLTGGESRLDTLVELEGREVAAKAFASTRDPVFKVHLGAASLDLTSPKQLRLEASGKGRLIWSARLIQYLNPKAVKPVNAGFSISRYLEASDGKDGPWPLGKEVDCVVTVINQVDRHHVLVEAPFPAGLEPVEAYRGRPLSRSGASSAFSWAEMRKDSAMLYSARLRPGVHTYRFRLRAVAPGSFHLRPARAEEMYAPEVYGTSPAGVVRINE